MEEGIVKQGYMWKVGKKSGAFKRRYYVIKEGSILEYSDSGAEVPKGND